LSELRELRQLREERQAQALGRGPLIGQALLQAIVQTSCKASRCGLVRWTQTAGGAPASITDDNSTELASKAMEAGISESCATRLNLAGQTAREWYVESFNGRLRDECLKVVAMAGFHGAAQ